MRHHDLLLQAWRETSRHDEVDPSAGAIAALLADATPIEKLLVFRFDPDHETIAQVAPTPPAPHPPGAGPDANSVKRLRAWAGKRLSAAAAGPDGLPPMLRAFARTLGDASVWVGALAHGESLGLAIAQAVAGKPFTARHLLDLDAVQEPLGVALDNDRRWHELAALREAAEADKRSLLRRLGRTDITEHIVGEKTGLAPVMRRVGLVSGSDAPVLLLGETGTGKEVVARTIHLRSDRHDGPFIRVNCGAIPNELIDSQLFGHEKGAFTGAAEMRKGWFERADGGTLFLDEIGELPAEAQVRFLRVLQDSLVERVGGGDPIRVDVRVIAATHRDLAAMAQTGAFREDLWYRIAVFPILLPPLRERPDDIPELTEHFARRAAARFGLPAVAPTQADFAMLRGYRWPGNIRELGAVIDRAAILGDGRSLEIEAALGFGATPSPAAPEARAATPARSHATLDDVARRHIEETLRKTRGKVEGPGGAAVLLGVNPHTLRSRMRRLGVRWAEYRN